MTLPKAAYEFLEQTPLTPREFLEDLVQLWWRMALPTIRLARTLGTEGDIWLARATLVPPRYELSTAPCEVIESLRDEVCPGDYAALRKALPTYTAGLRPFILLHKAEAEEAQWCASVIGVGSPVGGGDA